VVEWFFSLEVNKSAKMKTIELKVDTVSYVKVVVNQWIDFLKITTIRLLSLKIRRID
jgi:hypothetical protein